MNYDFLKKIPGAIRKPEPRKRAQRRKRRQEKAVVKTVRELCDDRDGRCRVAHPRLTTTIGDAGRYGPVLDILDDCSGPSEWAHLEDRKRARTRGEAPAKRHTTAGSCKFCRRHHRQYDAGEIAITFLEPERGADGLMRIGWGNV
jgi:hypothetical protein